MTIHYRRALLADNQCDMQKRVAAGVLSTREARARRCLFRSIHGRGGRRRDGTLVGAGDGAEMGVTRSGHDTRRLRIGGMGRGGRGGWGSDGRHAKGMGQRWVSRGAATTHGVSASAGWDEAAAGDGAAMGVTRCGYDT